MLAEEGLLHAALVSAHGGRGNRTDVQRLNGGLSAVVREEVVERIVLIGELGFAYRFAEVEENARARKDAAARAQNEVVEAGAGRSLKPEQRVVLDAAAQSVEEAIFEIAVHRQWDEVVYALDRRVVSAARFRAALVLILKSGETGQVRSDGDVALITSLIAIGDILDTKC